MYENYAGTINGKHTFRDYGLYVTNQNPIGPPAVKAYYVPVPGRNGDIDLTDALTGYTVYGNRTITLNLGGKKPSREWVKFMSDFLNEIHGKKVKVIFDNDKDWYYEGRATVEADYEKGNEIARFTLTINAEPYKYSLISASEPWLWGPFSLEDGIIRGYSQIAINGTKEVVVVGSEKPVIPDIITSSAMTVEFDGKNYSLEPGKNKVYDIVLRDQENVMKFMGTGTVSIEYRAGRL